MGRGEIGGQECPPTRPRVALRQFPFPGIRSVRGVGLGDIEFGDGGAAEGFEMGSAAEALAHFVAIERM